MITRLPHAARVLASAQSQHGQSTASDAMDGSGAGFGRGRSRAVGDDSAAHLVLDGSGLYRQRATEEACSLSTGRPSQAYPGLRLMPIGMQERVPEKRFLFFATTGDKSKKAEKAAIHHFAISLSTQCEV